MEWIAPETLEVVMLVCFGCSWPFAVAKTLRTRDVRGKSIIFITLIFIGYLCGFLHKLAGEYDGVIWLYIINGSLVFTEMALYWRFTGGAWFRSVSSAQPSIEPAQDNSR